MNGISAFIEGTPESSLALLLPGEAIRQQSATWKRALTRTWPCWHPILDFRTVRNKLLLFISIQQSTILCHSSRAKTQGKVLKFPFPHGRVRLPRWIHTELWHIQIVAGRYFVILTDAFPFTISFYSLTFYSPIFTLLPFTNFCLAFSVHCPRK